MNQTIKDFLAQIDALHVLRPENLPEDVIKEMRNMSATELYRTCTQFVILQNNIPSKEKIITLSEEEIRSLSEKYAKELLEVCRTRA